MKQSFSISSVAIMILAMGLIPLGDVGGKLLTQMGIAAIFVAWSRFVLGALLLAPFSRIKKHELPSLLDRRILLRGFFITGSIWTILSALSTEPMANVFSALFIAPIMSYFLSAKLFGENITLTRSLLLLLGFCGILIVVKPSLTMSSGMIFALSTAVFYTGYLLTSKWLVKFYRPRFMLMSQLLFGAIALMPFGIAHMPETISLSLILLVLLSACGSASGNLLLVESNRRLPGSVVAPLVYIQLVFATCYGLWFFDEVPDTLTMIGLLLILSSGLLSFFFARRDEG